jgi:predicted nucleic acid-binding Zn ribbon protein
MKKNVYIVNIKNQIFVQKLDQLKEMDLCQMELLDSEQNKERPFSILWVALLSLNIQLLLKYQLLK